MMNRVRFPTLSLIGCPAASFALPVRPCMLYHRGLAVLEDLMGTSAKAVMAFLSFGFTDFLIWLHAYVDLPHAC
jgi:hypothetical protein